jgi:hypothetical protein
MVRGLAVVAVLSAALVLAGCGGPDGCASGETRCEGDTLEQCRPFAGWTELADCAQLGQQLHRDLVCGYSQGSLWNPPGDNCVERADRHP